MGSTSSAAAPASKRLISSRSASSASNRSSSPASSSAERATEGSKPTRDSWMRSTAIRIVVSGVRSSCETSETNRCCTADSPSSWRIWDWRLSAIAVERRREEGEVVLAARRHPLVELAGRQALGDPTRAAHGGDDLAGDDPGDGADEEGEDDAGDDERVADEVHRRDLLLHRVDEVEVVGAGVRHLDDAADDDRGHVLPVDRDLAHLGLLTTRVRRDGRLQLGAHRGEVERLRSAGWRGRCRCRCRRSGS